MHNLNWPTDSFHFKTVMMMMMMMMKRKHI